MANDSSFSGSVRAYITDDQGRDTPFDPDMLLILYDVLLAYGDSYYGFSLSGEGSEDSADFLATMLDLDPVDFYGTGRWSAQNTIENFNNYVFTKHRDSNLTPDQHKANVEKLIDYMATNDGTIDFEYVDEESGIGFIVQQTALITAESDPSSATKLFIVNVDTNNSADYNIRGYADLVEETEEGTYRETLESIMTRLDIPMSKYDVFKNFIIQYDYDTYLYPFTEYWEQDNEGNYYYDLPEELEEEWKKHVQH